MSPPLGLVEFELTRFTGDYFILKWSNDGGRRYVEERIPELLKARPPDTPRGWPFVLVMKGCHLVPVCRVEELKAMIYADFAADAARKAARARLRGSVPPGSSNGTAH
jgi:hypothetical protein